MLGLAACTSQAGSTTGSPKAVNGMVSQLVLASEVDSSVGNLINYNPYSPTP